MNASQHMFHDTAIQKSGAATQAELDAITQRNRTHSPILRLPGEIRNRMYEYALGGNDLVPMESNIKGTGFSFYLTSGPTNCAEPSRQHWLGLCSLPATCRDLRLETKTLPLSLNMFQWENNFTTCLWLKNITKEARAAIRYIWFGEDAASRFSSEHLHLYPLPNVRKVILNGCSKATEETITMFFTKNRKCQVVSINVSNSPYHGTRDPRRLRYRSTLSYYRTAMRRSRLQ
ncbi:hypothetical protein N0V94_007109 [Neodidymelliopsis sp. IMI 364377]|nr:hypothetical protein N0V94_007109 [Neodidymelliopsis sp. IMI 364377]